MAFFSLIKAQLTIISDDVNIFFVATKANADNGSSSLGVLGWLTGAVAYGISLLVVSNILSDIFEMRPGKMLLFRVSFDLDAFLFIKKSFSPQ